MIKRFPVATAALLALSIVATGCAKENPPPRPQPPAKEAAGTQATDTTGAQKKAAPNPRVKLFTGTIVALDVEAGTLTLKGPKGARGFKAREKGKMQLEDLKVGDKVIVKHLGEAALSIVKPRTRGSDLASGEKKVL